MDKAVEERFTAFVAERTPALFRTAYALTGGQHDAEDLLQNALARTALRWHRIHSDPEHYVRRVMYREFVSAWRWRRRRPPEVSGADVPDAATPADIGEDTVARLFVERLLRDLPPRQRAVVVLRYLEDMSEAEVAAILDCAPGTVASQASRALAKLRASLSTAPASSGPGPASSRLSTGEVAP